MFLYFIIIIMQDLKAWEVYRKESIIIDGYIYDEKNEDREKTWKRKVWLKYVWRRKNSEWKWNDEVLQQHMLLTDLAKAMWLDSKDEEKIKSSFAWLRLVTTTSISSNS